MKPPSTPTICTFVANKTTPFISRARARRFTRPNVSFLHNRPLCSSSVLREIRDASGLLNHTAPTYEETSQNSLLSLRWPAPPQNILLVKKEFSQEVTQSLVLAAKNIHSSYPGVCIILEPGTAEEVHDRLPFPVYTPLPQATAIIATGTTKKEDGFTLEQKRNQVYQRIVDLICTLGGDGTILHASSLFATSTRVPPMIPFSMGSLGFLGGWSFEERKRAFREVYMSGSSGSESTSVALEPLGSVSQTTPEAPVSPQEQVREGIGLKGWSSVQAYSCGARKARVLLRQRLQISLHTPLASSSFLTLSPPLETPEFAMNEVLLHRGATPHLAVLSISINGHFLTDAIADGIIISTPTGSTAYSLSSGGAIVHPSVPALLLTPICPRSLSFRPLVLPASASVEIHVSEKARSGSIGLSVDGKERETGVGRGMVVRVQAEDLSAASVPADLVSEISGWRKRTGCVGGVPTVVRGALQTAYGLDGDRDAHWVGGLNGLLKFNHPFGDDRGD